MGSKIATAAQMDDVFTDFRAHALAQREVTDHMENGVNLPPLCLLLDCLSQRVMVVHLR